MVLERAFKEYLFQTDTAVSKDLVQHQASLAHGTDSAHLDQAR